MANKVRYEVLAAWKVAECCKELKIKIFCGDKLRYLHVLGRWRSYPVNLM
jgi:hypothetical protein